MRYLFILLAVSSAMGGRSRISHHSYPHSSGYSGTSSGSAHTYPRQGGLSGNSNNYIYNRHQSSTQNHYQSKTEVHHHHYYSPPPRITYGSVSYPVYHGSPPVYVYTYKDSGSRFDNLLTGLALYNLGRMSANNHHSYDNYHHSSREYSGTPGELCKLGVRQRNSYEETRIDCKLMSSFIYSAGPTATEQRASSSNTVITSVTNVTHYGINNSTSVTVTVKNETLKEALNVKGPSLKVTPGMVCYMIRMYRGVTALQKEVECGVLEQYALNSMRNHSKGLKAMVSLNLFLFFYYAYVY